MDLPTQLHPVSELQDRAPQLIQESSTGPVGITRYGRLVAALISPDDLASFRDLQRAAERALWTLDTERAARDVERGDVEEWNDVVKRLRRRFSR